MASLYPPISKKEIDDYEQRTGIDLPAEYKRFLLSTNGMVPSPDQLQIPNTEHAVLVGILYGIRQERVMGDIEYVTKLHEDDLPDGFIAIGHDPGGNSFLLGTKKATRGKVYFWDKRGLLKARKKKGNTYWLGDSIDDVLDALYEPVDESEPEEVSVKPKRKRKRP